MSLLLLLMLLLLLVLVLLLLLLLVLMLALAHALAPSVTSQPVAHPNDPRMSPPPIADALPQLRHDALVATPLLLPHPISGNTCCSSSRSLC